jgi:hypothetical protein
VHTELLPSPSIDNTDLELPFLEEEIWDEINSLTGLDGFTAIFYKIYSPLITEAIMKVMNWFDTLDG